MAPTNSAASTFNTLSFTEETLMPTLSPTGGSSGGVVPSSLGEGGSVFAISRQVHDEPLGFRM
jgi:hypothetical protein